MILHRWVIVLISAIVLALMFLAVWQVERASSHHSGPWLPYAGKTALMLNIKADGVVNWCADSRARNYPGFMNQVRQVNAEYSAIVGVSFQEVGQGAGCEVVHSMPDYNFCSGCAAHIFYANWPVLIEYKYTLGYADWQTTIGHELGHGILGLHEQYTDTGFIGCRSLSRLIAEGPGPTVMSCGTGIKYPTEWDRDNGWAKLIPWYFNGGALGAGPFIWYGGSDENTTRVAVWMETYAGFQFWTGQYLEAVRDCTAIVCGGAPLALPIGPCTSVLLGHENAMPGSYGRALQRIGGTPC